MDRGDIANRMKQYEVVPKSSLIRRMPVIIRIDGKSFHSFTRNFDKPFDDVLIEAMQETAKYLCENIQGCVLAYTQSDEISLVLVDYQKLTTSAWFDNEVQKICSISASMATMAFNKYFDIISDQWLYDHTSNLSLKELEKLCEDKQSRVGKLYNSYTRALRNGAMFDSRCFNLPKEEVTNYIYWRQLDASRNSIQMVGQANFSHKELQNKSCNDIQDMLMTQKGINWNDLPTYKKRGTCVIKDYCIEENPSERGNNTEVERSRWVIDYNIPIFKGQDREYIDKLVFVGE